eukprot:CAMPEP_0197824084 /NCGR_PEP_ID=MMETSP1437-20131217/1390_1 /TAXON_ID=49252 ORGANISM="Eucampia antarctica, Strain CCMP1452" /NCGR_SAMPLE_ID=MMETSP1437 /ASSEMBLY_ACC=CAM_ASM_001096 /LENGTH=258 /DNA_ID=CAMNT_0043423579 /DNA_START=15 /DNA_END=791 /DNA_ORIENTATION=-
MKLSSFAILAAVTAPSCSAFAPQTPGGAFIITHPTTSSFSVDQNSKSDNNKHDYYYYNSGGFFSFSLRMAAYESIEEIEMDAEERMSKSVSSVDTTLATIRTGRANASMLDRVQVIYYGASTALNQMAAISVPNSQQLQIQPYDKTALVDIEKAIIESDLGLTPNNDGDVIRINIPSLTEDRRKEMLKQCKALGEDGKVAIRNVRRDCVDSVKKMEKASTVSEDQSKDGLDAMQKLTDQYIKEIESNVAKKEKEVMTV